MNNIFYTYIYLDPRKSGLYKYGDYTFDYEPFYVGKGFNNQYISHLKEAKVKELIRGNTHKFYKIKNILKENIEPVILKVEENISEQEAFELEIYLIWAIGRSDLRLGSLTNLTDGGEGTINISDETRRKMSDWQRDGKNPNYGKVSTFKGKRHSEETKQKMSVSAKIKIFTVEHRHRMSETRKGKSTWNKGIPHSQETIKKFKESRKGKNNGMYGKLHSEESKRKMSEAKRKI